MTPAQFERALQTALERLGEPLPSGAAERLIAYVSELRRWNRAYNLTAVTDQRAIIDRHLIESLSLRPYLNGRRILDAGTGAGLPGVVLAIAEPERDFILVDSNGKKIRFLRHVQRALGMANVDPVQARLETLTLDPPPDEIVSRAFAPLARQAEWLAPMISKGARLLAMKGAVETAELDQVPDAYNVRLEILDGTGSAARRSLVIVTSGERRT